MKSSLTPSVYILTEHYRLMPFAISSIGYTRFSAYSQTTIRPHVYTEVHISMSEKRVPITSRTSNTAVFHLLE